jgi:hypothetical protein
MRDVLIDHLDGAAVIIVEPSNFQGLDARQAGHRLQTTAALIERGLLRPDREVKPRHTTITDAGRAQLCRLLAEYAEVLIRVEAKREADGPTAPSLRWHPRGSSAMDASVASGIG